MRRMFDSSLNVTPNQALVSSASHQAEASIATTTSVSFVIISVILLTIVIATIVGNLFVILAIFTDKNLQTTANQLVLSLAVADLMVACLVMPLGAYNDIYQGWYLSKEWCEFWTSADVLCCTASILNLLAIAVDRYWAVTNVDYIYRRTKRRVNVMILCAWTVGAVVSLAPIFGWKDPDFGKRVIEEHKCMVSQDVSYQIFATISTFYAPLFILLALYWRIFQVARKRIHRKPGRRVAPVHEEQTKQQPAELIPQVVSVSGSRQSQMIEVDGDQNEYLNSGKTSDSQDIDGQQTRQESKGGRKTKTKTETERTNNGQVEIVSTFVTNFTTETKQVKNEESNSTATSTDIAIALCCSQIEKESKWMSKTNVRNNNPTARVVGSENAQSNYNGASRNTAREQQPDKQPPQPQPPPPQLPQVVDSFREADGPVTLTSDKVEAKSGHKVNQQESKLKGDAKFHLEKSLGDAKFHLEKSLGAKDRADYLGQSHNQDLDQFVKGNRLKWQIVINDRGSGCTTRADSSHIATNRATGPTSGPDKASQANACSVLSGQARAALVGDRSWASVSPSIVASDSCKDESMRLNDNKNNGPKQTQASDTSSLVARFVSQWKKERRGLSGGNKVAPLELFEVDLAAGGDEDNDSRTKRRPTIARVNGQDRDRPEPGTITDPTSLEGISEGNRNQLKIEPTLSLLSSSASSGSHCTRTSSSSTSSSPSSPSPSPSSTSTSTSTTPSPSASSSSLTIPATSSSSSAITTLDEDDSSAFSVMPSTSCVKMNEEDVSAGLQMSHGICCKCCKYSSTTITPSATAAAVVGSTSGASGRNGSRCRCCCSSHHHHHRQVTRLKAANSERQINHELLLLERRQLSQANISSGQQDLMLAYLPHEPSGLKETASACFIRAAKSTATLKPPTQGSPRSSEATSARTNNNGNYVGKRSAEADTAGSDNDRKCKAMTQKAAGEGGESSSADVINQRCLWPMDLLVLAATNLAAPYSSLSDGLNLSPLRLTGLSAPTDGSNPSVFGQVNQCGESGQSVREGDELRQAGLAQEQEGDVEAEDDDYDDDYDDESSLSADFPPCPAPVSRRIAGSELPAHSSGSVQPGPSSTSSTPPASEPERLGKSHHEKPSNIVRVGRRINNPTWPEEQLTDGSSSVDMRGEKVVSSYNKVEPLSDFVIGPVILNTLELNSSELETTRWRPLVKEASISQDNKQARPLSRQEMIEVDLIKWPLEGRPRSPQRQQHQLQLQQQVCQQVAHPKRSSLDIRRRFRAMGQLVSFIQMSRNPDGSLSVSSGSSSASSPYIHRETKDSELKPPDMREDTAGGDAASGHTQRVSSVSWIGDKLHEFNDEQMNQLEVPPMRGTNNTGGQWSASSEQVRLWPTNTKSMTQTSSLSSSVYTSGVASNNNNGAGSNKISDGSKSDGRCSMGQQQATIKQQTRTVVPATTATTAAATTTTTTGNAMRRARANMEIKREKKAAKTLAIITGVFVCCWLPFFLNAIIMPICGETCTPSDLILSILLWLGYLNSLLNPIIYTIFSPDFRRAFRRLLCWPELINFNQEINKVNHHTKSAGSKQLASHHQW